MTHAEEDALIEQSIYDASSSSSVNWRQAIRLAIRAAVAQEREWREAVLNELIVACIYMKEHDTNPHKAIQDAITWNCQVALDPRVSSDARKLIEYGKKQERERCANAVFDLSDGQLSEIARAIRKGE